MVAGEFYSDIDERAGLVLARNDATCELAARLMVTWSLPGIATDATTTALTFKLVLLGK